MIFDIHKAANKASVFTEDGDDREFVRDLMRRFLRNRITSITSKSDRVGLRIQFYIVASIACGRGLPKEVRYANNDT